MVGNADSLNTPRPRKVASHRSLRSESGSITDREGKAIVEVGKAGESVPIDLLQSLYLTGPLLSSPSPPSSGRSSPQPFHCHSDSREEVGLGLGGLGYPSITPTQWPRTISFSSTTTFPPVKRLSARDRKRILVTGGAGFVGSHLVDRLMFCGHDVTVLDNFFSGSKAAIGHWIGHPNFELVRADVVEPFMVEVDQIYHLACPASPKAYQSNAVKTLKTNFLGTLNMLGLAKRVKARFLLSSTSEIYGSPTVHPQTEEYWGNVNCVGPRACYDEGKRVAEALTYGYHRQDGVDVRVARIFNCYGPRMNSSDGRVVSNFIVAALRGEPLEIYGDGTQTRSLMYIHDLVTGLMALMASDCSEPVNIGSEDESTVAEWANVVRDTVDRMRDAGEIPMSAGGGGEGPEGPEGQEGKEGDFPKEAEEGKFGEGRELGGPVVAKGSPLKPPTKTRSEIVYKDAVVDDPPRRRPDITRARTVLGWEPKWTIEAGIEETVRYFAAKEEGDPWKKGLGK